MKFRELMEQRESILQGIEERELELFKRMEEEHYKKVFNIIREQAKVMNHTVEQYPASFKPCTLTDFLKLSLRN